MLDFLEYTAKLRKRFQIMKDRYKVELGSQSGHCCFEYTVVDTTKPYMVAGKQYRDRFQGICECFDKGIADQICEALNKQQQ